jgi:hypothetical protein
VGTFDVAKPVAALVRLEHSTVIPNTLEVSFSSINQLYIHVELLGNTPEVRLMYTNSLQKWSKLSISLFKSKEYRRSLGSPPPWSPPQLLFFGHLSKYTRSCLLYFS